MRSPLPSRLYYRNTAGQLLLDDAGFLRVQWNSGTRTLADTRALFAHMQQALQEFGWSRILINQLEMPPFSAEEQHWVAHEWLPQAVQAGGYRHVAVVVSHEVLVRLATAYITTNAQGLTLTYRSFEQEDEARGWLLRQPASPAPLS